MAATLGIGYLRLAGSKRLAQELALYVLKSLEGAVKILLLEDDQHTREHNQRSLEHAGQIGVLK